MEKKGGRERERVSENGCLKWRRRKEKKQFYVNEYAGVCKRNGKSEIY